MLLCLQDIDAMFHCLQDINAMLHCLQDINAMLHCLQDIDVMLLCLQDIDAMLHFFLRCLKDNGVSIKSNSFKLIILLVTSLETQRCPGNS